MSRYLFVIFPDGGRAYEGSRAFKDLHNEGSLTLYGLAVVAKDDEGRVSIKEAADEGPIGTAVGMLVGSIVGILGGPAGVALGATGGVLLGSISDLSNAGVGVDFVTAVSEKMDAGTVAVVAEVDEYWIAPVDTRMGKLGGTVIRRARADFVDQQIKQEVQALNTELDQLDAELKQASADAKAALESKIGEVRTSLQAAQTKAKERIQQLENESRSKIKELQDQASKVSSEAKAKIDNRIEEVKTDYNARVDKLRQAWDLTKQALA